MTRQALVIGATQGTGERIANLLIDGGWKVTVLARNRAKAEAKFANVIEGDLTRRETIPRDLSAFEAIILTAGVTKRPAGEELVRTTEYEGTLSVLEAAKNSGARLLYMTTIGVRSRTFLGTMLNLAKGKTMHWRRKAEEAIRESGVPYTIIRAGLLNDALAGTHRLAFSQGPLPLTFSRRVSRADMADVFVAALNEVRTVNASFNVVWGERGDRQPVAELLESVKPDA